MKGCGGDTPTPPTWFSHPTPPPPPQAWSPIIGVSPSTSEAIVSVTQPATSGSEGGYVQGSSLPVPSSEPESYNKLLWLCLLLLLVVPCLLWACAVAARQEDDKRVAEEVAKNAPVVV